jgi:hypothetical protein
VYEGSPLRLAAACLFLAMLAGALAWTLWTSRDTAGGAVAAPPASSAVEPSAAEPSPPAEPEVADEPVGPATGDYAELATAAELEHPDTDPHIRRWYDWFGYYVGDEQIPEGVWSNKQELWDRLAPIVRAEAGLLGAPFDDSVYDGDTAQPATADVRWSTADTRGRGEVVEFSAMYLSTEGRVTARYWAALIAVGPDGVGHVRATMEPFELLITDYEDFASFRSRSGDLIWAWVEEQKADS